MDMLKKLVNLGFGAWDLTREKLEGTANELIKRGEISSEEAKKFVDELVEKAESNKKELDTRIQKIVENTLNKMHIPTQSEFDELNKKVDALTAQLKALKKSIYTLHSHESDTSKADDND